MTTKLPPGPTTPRFVQALYALTVPNRGMYRMRERYGATAEEQKKKFVQEVLVPEMLFGEEALARKLDADPKLKDKVRESLRDAVDRNLREEALKAQPITPEEIQKYYDDNKARYETPKRIKIWRIQVPDEPAAKAIIALAKGADGPKRWSDEAREWSLDTATAQRSGERLAKGARPVSHRTARPSPQASSGRRRHCPPASPPPAVRSAPPIG